MTGERRASAEVHHPALSPVRRHRERGVVYLLVLSTTIVVLAIMLGSIAVVRAQRAEAFDTFATTRAATLARSGLELAMSRIEASGFNWRDDYVAGESSGVNVAMVDRGVIIYRVSDPDDGNLRDDPWDEVEITGYGIWNEAQRMMSVRATPTGSAPYSFLRSSLHIGGALVFDGAAFKAARDVTCNGDVLGKGGTNVRATVSAAGAIAGKTFWQGVSAGRPLSGMPNPSDVLRYYVDKGQRVPLSLFPGEDVDDLEIVRGATIHGVLLENDILVIECAGKDVRIRNCRIAATLVLLDAGDGSEVRESVSWIPPHDGMPALICDGDLKIEIKSDPLKESSVKVSLNTLIPSADGTTDNDQTDVYDSQLAGLFYIAGDLELRGETSIFGCVAATGAALVRGSILIEPDPALDRSTPPEFAAPDRLVLRRGTLRRVIP